MGWYEDEATPVAVDADEVLDRMMVLSLGDGAIDLRIGELLATLSGMDFRLLDYSTFTGLVQEEVDVDPSWASQLIRLAKSDLAYVKLALCRGVIPISAAVKAPGRVTVEEQVDWVEAVRSGEINFRSATPRVRVDLENPEDVVLVHETCEIARRVIGYPCREEGVHQHILRAWRNQVDGRQLVREASEPRDPPTPEDLERDPLDDPAAEALGPRVIPRDVYQAQALLKETLGKRRTRRLEQGLLYDQVVEQKLYLKMGFDTAAEMVRKSLRVTQRTLQNCRDEALAFSFYPELAFGIAAGVDCARLMAIFEIATEDNVLRWLAVASRTTVMELKRATAWAAETGGDTVLERYEWAIAETKDAHSWVALKAARRPPRPPRVIEGVHPDLVEACRWYKANVRLPNPTGFPAVKVREQFTCEGPLCNRITLRVESHHKHARRYGGGDEASNAACLCRPCHLRGVHANDMFTFVGGGETGPDVWTYPTGRRIVVF